VGAFGGVSNTYEGDNPLMPRLYHIHTTAGTWEVYAVTAAQAVTTVLELAEPGARVLRIARQGDW
jgi:hypothetical protein